MAGFGGAIAVPPPHPLPPHEGEGGAFSDMLSWRQGLGGEYLGKGEDARAWGRAGWHGICLKGGCCG